MLRKKRGVGEELWKEREREREREMKSKKEERKYICLMNI
jgi:hypothetical protein